MNYVRESVAAGVPVTEASLVDGTDKAWMDDKYLIPFMENDSLLFELDGALGLDAESGMRRTPQPSRTPNRPGCAPSRRRTRR